MVETGIRDAAAVGLLVRELREARGWSLRQLALRAGVTHTWIGKLETGLRARVDIGDLSKLAEALGVEVEYLYREGGDERGLERAADEIAEQWIALGRREREMVSDFIKLVKGIGSGG